MRYELGDQIQVGIDGRIKDVKLIGYTRGIPQQLMVEEANGKTYKVPASTVISDIDEEDVVPMVIDQTPIEKIIMDPEGFKMTGRVSPREIDWGSGYETIMEVESAGRITLDEMLVQYQGEEVEVQVRVLRKIGANDGKDS